MELSYWEKQLILQTKGHIGRPLDGRVLTEISARHFGIPPEYVTPINVRHLLYPLFEKLVQDQHIRVTMMSLFEDIQSEALNRGGTILMSGDDVDKAVLSKIQNIRVLHTNLNLGKADADLVKWATKLS